MITKSFWRHVHFKEAFMMRREENGWSFSDCFCRLGCQIVSSQKKNVWRHPPPLRELNLSKYKGCVCCCLPLPLSRKTKDEQVVVLLPVADVNQVFPQQKRRTETGNKTCQSQLTKWAAESASMWAQMNCYVFQLQIGKKNSRVQERIKIIYEHKSFFLSNSKNIWLIHISRIYKKKIRLSNWKGSLS